MDTNLKGYISAFEKWKTATKTEILESELKVQSDKYDFKGILDAVIRVNGKVILLDYKTGVKLHKQALILQLSAYKQALSETKPELKIDKIAGLLLTENGIYTYQEYPDNFEGFLLLLKFWNWSRTLPKIRSMKGGE